MSEQPLISVIIPVYNRAAEALACLVRLEQQRYKHIEVIVVDDGSTDGFAQMLAGRTWVFPFQFRRLEKNSGAPTARNEGFRLSSGTFVLFLDADVELNPDALERMVTALQNHPEHAFAYVDFYFGWKFFKTGIYDFGRLKRMNFIHTSSLIRRETFPGFDESLKKFQDWDLWLTMGERGKTGFWIPETLMRVKTGGIMSRWMPKFFHRLPWGMIGWMPEEIRRYRVAEAIIRKKHP